MVSPATCEIINSVSSPLWRACFLTVITAERVIITKIQKKTGKETHPVIHITSVVTITALTISIILLKKE